VRNLYAVIPSGQRTQQLSNLLHDLVHYSDVKVIVVDTGYEHFFVDHPRIQFIQDHDPVKNISRWWNNGLAAVYAYQDVMHPGEEFTVAVLNDDLRVPPRFVEQLDENLNLDGRCAAACPAPGMRTAGWVIVDRDLASPRMTGFAFALRGSLKLLADERFVWWYGDNDLDWRARQMGGVMHVGGSWEGFVHLHPDSTTVGELAEQAGRDRETFVEKWGRPPW
jgi:hypothetical protein